MAIKDIFNKGVDMINKGASAAKEAAMEKRKAMQEFDLLKTRSDHIGPLYSFEIKNVDPQMGREQLILNACLTINVEKAKLVNQLIPVDETIVDLKTTKEAKTEIDYIFVITDRRLWILNQREYMTYEFAQVRNCEIINRGVMTQGVKFDEKAFYIDGNETDVKKFIDILMNPNFRHSSTSKAQNYLCGIIPQRQLLNINLKGISIGHNGEIVIHNGQENKLTNINEISYMQILVNDAVAIVKGRQNDSFVSSPMEARKISVKFVFNMGEYEIEILSPSLMNTSYKREESTYIDNFDFARKLVDTIVGML